MEPETLAIGLRAEAPSEPAFREIFDVSYRRLVVQLYGVVGDFVEAEDLVQEAFVRAAAAGRRFLRVENHEAWLRTTAVNVHRNRWRKLRNYSRIRDRLVTQTDPPGLEDRLDVITALRLVPEAQRQVLSLYYFADLPVDEIAETLGVAAGTVKSRLSRGRAALAVSLGTEEGSNHE